MLLGEYKHTLDTKGRVAIPAKFRAKLGDGAIVTKGLDKCLFIFGAKEWKGLADKLKSMPIARSDSRALNRFMFAGASDARVDTQGRVLLPDSLREYAGLKKQVVIVGLYDRMEIWNADAWAKYKKKTEGSSEEIAEKLSELGI